MSTKVMFAVLALALVAGATATTMECSDIMRRGLCRSSDQKFGFPCYWNPEMSDCEEIPTNCTDIADKRHCNKAKVLLGTEDNCVWDNQAEECYAPTECDELNTKNRCKNYMMYPTVEVVDGGCKYNMKMGCYLDVYPTECEEIVKKGACNNALKNFGFPCFFQNRECIAPPTECEDIVGKGKCRNAAKNLGIKGCTFVEGDDKLNTVDMCKTITCEDIMNKKKCNEAEDKMGLTCFYSKVQGCMTL